MKLYNFHLREGPFPALLHTSHSTLLAPGNCIKSAPEVTSHPGWGEAGLSSHTQCRYWDQIEPRTPATRLTGPGPPGMV